MKTCEILGLTYQESSNTYDSATYACQKLLGDQNGPDYA